MTAAAKFFVPVQVAGPTGATAATRYAGATASGAPASGTFLKGDFVIDQTGSIWICTTAGSPGTWAQAGAGAVSSVFGRTGAVVAATNDYTEAQLSFSDITTNNVSTSKHGLAPKAPNDATKYLDGTGAYSTPSGTGSAVLGARVYNSGTQSISDSTDTALTFDTENFDTDTIHSTGSNTSRLTATTAGKYVIQCQVEFAASATGVRTVQIKLNGTTVIASNRKLSLSTGVTQLQVETVYNLAATDYVEVIVNQTSGLPLNVDAGLGTTWFGMVAQAPQGATGATGATGPAASLTSADATLSGDVTMTTAGTFYDGPSASLVAGTWLVFYKLLIAAPSTATQAHTGKLWDGSTVYDESEVDAVGNTTATVLQVSGFAVIVLGSTTTVKASATSARNGATIKRDVPSSSASSHSASRLSAIKIA